MSIIPWLCWIAPFIGFIVTPLIGKKIGRVRDYIEPVFTLISAFCATTLISAIIDGKVIHEEIPWIEELGINIGILIDPLSVIMANVVTWIGFLIMVYSIEYMKDDPSVNRFWTMMNLFVGGMLLLILSDNFVQMFIGWELVGVASFSLIGFYYRDEREYWIENYPPSHCSMKAFVITKIGDLLMLIGALIIYTHSGTLNFVKLAEDLSWVGSLARSGLLLPTLLFLLCGPLGKSAQFPFHEWLPEAMAGPTPVSALIHAATMVKAGVYFIARILPILHYAYWELGYADILLFFYIVAFIGAFTTFLAGSQAIVAKELKKILAYSTISQIGYMMLGLGVAGLLEEYIVGLAAAIFHLISHAVFKALLFLSAGAVIHSVETKYVTEMGGLRRYMRITFYCMLIGAMALAGLPPLSGFWSKDAILLSTALSGRALLLLLGLATAGVTMFYSLRMIGLIFFGEESEHIKEIKSEGHHIHEVNPIMWIPYCVMSILTIIIGIIGPFLEGELHNILALNVVSYTHSYTELVVIRGATELEGELWHILVPLLSIIMLIVGGVPSYIIYIDNRLRPEQIVESSALLKAIYKFLVMRWYINPVYYAVFVDGLINVSTNIYNYLERSLNGFNSVFVKFFTSLALLMFSDIEQRILEGFNASLVQFFKGSSSALFSYMELITLEGFNMNLARFFRTSSQLLRRIQTGILSYNIIEIVIGMLILILFTIFGLLMGGA